MGRHKTEYFFFIDDNLIPMMMNKRKWQDQQRNDDSMANGKIRSVKSRSQGSNSQQKILKSRSEHVKDSISEFWIPGVGGVKSRDSSSQES
jgi:hypothetical protein